ncbi:hypothetical protein [Streptomyces boncukensis]|uniref:NB-ARC domain-containing protein n=1 Tax=Streptomyces boncukensis TaxID=2711219 RepID=A0A6G4WWX0_9ACTN|nr:hypothetical protein [Streptomyces boncukensis]NGO68951.1 hypothetical protein [Streptomyces boncukensis]
MEGARSEYPSNELSGSVTGPVVQAGPVHGGISFQVQPQPVTGPDVKPDQVPATTVPFVNRESDLAWLDERFGGGGAAGSGVEVGVVYGLRGLGKSSVVSRWAERCRERFPDGQIYVDFAPSAGRSGGGDVSDAVWRCLRALGVGERAIPAALEDRRALFRSRSAGRRLLIVCENVSDSGQVRALVPKGRGSALLATSHGRIGELAYDGYGLLALGPFDRRSGLALLADRCGAAAVAEDPQAAARLVELCGGHPQALSVLAARLVNSPRLTMSRLADELAQETGRMAALSVGAGEEYSVSAAFDLAYDELAPDAARMYRMAGLIPGRAFDAATAAVAAGTDRRSAESLLDALEAARLVEALEDDRYRFHELARLHARERAAAEEPQEARRAVLERVATHYLVLTAQADRALGEDRLRIADLTGFLPDACGPFGAGDAPLSALDWLEAEHLAILAVLRDGSDAGLHTLVWQLAEAFTVLFFRHRHLAVWEEALRLGAGAAAACAVPAAEARLRSLLSRPLMDLERFPAARTELDAAMACAQVSGDAVLSASVLEFDGRYWDRFDVERAIAAYRRSAELNRQADERRGEAIATYFLGCALDARGEHAAALETLHRAHRALLACQDHRMAARALLARGRALAHRGDTAAAKAALGEAAGVLREQRAEHYEAQAREELARVLHSEREHPAAVRAEVARAAEIYEAEGHPAAAGMRDWLDRLAGEG